MKMPLGRSRSQPQRQRQGRQIVPVKLTGIFAALPEFGELIANMKRSSLRMRIDQAIQAEA
jgi:hypothetical protein